VFFDYDLYEKRNNKEEETSCKRRLVFFKDVKKGRFLEDRELKFISLHKIDLFIGFYNSEYPKPVWKEHQDIKHFIPIPYLKEKEDINIEQNEVEALLSGYKSLKLSSSP